MKTALVTGASRGLGAAFVELLLKDGYQVFASYRSIDPEDPLSKLPSKKLHLLEMDVSNDESISRASREISSKTSRLDLLINNAGINHDSPGMHKPSTTKLGELKRQELVDMFQINTIAPVLVAQAFLPLLVGSKIINISSYRASFTHRDQDANFSNYGYASSKVALNMMTRDLAHDLEPINAAVFAIDPGSVRTAMNKSGEQSPAEAAQKILVTVERFNLENSGKYYDNQGNVALL